MNDPETAEAALKVRGRAAWGGFPILGCPGCRFVTWIDRPLSPSPLPPTYHHTYHRSKTRFGGATGEAATATQRFQKRTRVAARAVMLAAARLDPGTSTRIAATTTHNRREDRRARAGTKRMESLLRTVAGRGRVVRRAARGAAALPHPPPPPIWRWSRAICVGSEEAMGRRKAAATATVVAWPADNPPFLALASGAPRTQPRCRSVCWCAAKLVCWVRAIVWGVFVPFWEGGCFYSFLPVCVITMCGRVRQRRPPGEKAAPRRR